MENLAQVIENAYKFHIQANFGDDVEATLPKFSAYRKANGKLVVFAGMLSDTKHGKLMKALEVYNNVIGEPSIVRKSA